MAQLFAEHGAGVFLTARTEKELAATAEGIAANGHPAAYLAADLTREADCAGVMQGARKRFGRVDILVNNAGHYGAVVPLEEYPLEEFETVVEDMHAGRLARGVLTL